VCVAYAENPQKQRSQTVERVSGSASALTNCSRTRAGANLTLCCSGHSTASAGRSWSRPSLPAGPEYVRSSIPWLHRKQRASAQRLASCHVVPRQGSGRDAGVDAARFIWPPQQMSTKHYHAPMRKTHFSAPVRRARRSAVHGSTRAIESKPRRMLKDGVGMLRIAADLDICSGTVWRIARGTRS
jgi:hypothetical protein